MTNFITNNASHDGVLVETLLEEIGAVHTDFGNGNWMLALPPTVEAMVAWKNLHAKLLRYPLIVMWRDSNTWKFRNLSGE